MIRRIYRISGFDCANCAHNAEIHLNKHQAIESATIDFASDRLHVVFKDEELSVEELLKIIQEVEDDPIEIEILDKSRNRVYSICGFDCANCAHSSEVHLNKHESIEKATIDFANDRLHITFKDKILTAEEILAIIKEVEDDPIEIKELKNKKEKKKVQIFTKDNWILLARILFAIIVIIISEVVLDPVEHFYIILALNIIAIIVLCYDVTWKVIKHIIHKENPIDEFLLIDMAVVGAFIVASITRDTHDFMEALMVASLFQIGQVIEGVATNKSKQAISTAVDLRVDKAHKLDGEEIKEIESEDIKVGDLLIVTTGELIPVDAKIVNGDGLIDTSSLTGEFVPVVAKENEEVFSGCLVKEGTITIEAIREYKDSAVSKVIDLITNSGEKKSKAEEFVTKFARWYTPIVLTIAVLVAIIGGIVTSDWSGWAILGLKMLVVACPCAIVISVPMAYFSAIGLASKNGIVVKGAKYLEKLIEMRKLVTDKTGTLTKGEFKITKVCPNNISEEELLEAIYAAESLSNHPIGKAICAGIELSDISKNCSNFLEEAGLGVSITYKDQKILAGNHKMLEKHQIEYQKAEDFGTIIYVAKNQKYAGYVVLSDEIKPDAKKMVDSLKKNNVDVVLLTGDKEENAKNICEQLGISSYHSELMPEDKITMLEKEMSKDYATAFLGDGINDAASIKEADIGFAMGAIGSDAAVECADIVLMNDNPLKVSTSLKIAKIARNVSIFNIAFALLIKISIELIAIISNLLGHPEIIPMWAAVLADTGLTVVLVINSMLILYRKIKE